MAGSRGEPGAALMPRAGGSPWARLLHEPGRFGFDAAVRILQFARRAADPLLVARFRTPPTLQFPPSDIIALQPDAAGKPPRVTVSVMGLTGPSGVMPRYYNEVLQTTMRDRSRSMHEFFDMLSHRLIALFAQAGTKYRPHRSAEVARLDQEQKGEKVSQALLSLTGFGSPELLPRFDAGADALLHYAGLMAARPRSADRLAALVSDWLGRDVEVLQFCGSWLMLPQDQQTRLASGRAAGRFVSLGIDAAIGVRAWDIQARIILRIGPLDRASFEALLPDRDALVRLVSLVRAFVGLETGFAVNPTIARADVPMLRLDANADPAPRLGWNCWMPPPAPLFGRGSRDADEAVFEAEMVEAVTTARRRR